MRVETNWTSFLHHIHGTRKVNTRNMTMWITRNPSRHVKNGGEIRCSGRVESFCSTCGTHCVTTLIVIGAIRILIDINQSTMGFQIWQWVYLISRPLCKSNVVSINPARGQVYSIHALWDKVCQWLEAIL